MDDCTSDIQNVEGLSVKEEEIIIEDVHSNEIFNYSPPVIVTGEVENNIKIEPTDYNESSFEQDEEGSGSSSQCSTTATAASGMGTEATTDLSEMKEQGRKRTFECVDATNETIDSEPSHSTSDSLFICKFCENRFKTYLKLYFHEPLCSKNPGSNLIHVKKTNRLYAEQKMITIINGRKFYVCQYCNYKTVKSRLFDKHFPRHAREEYLYLCKICNGNLLNPFDLVHHFQMFHPSEQEPYHCPRCSFKTERVALLRKHWKKHYDFYCNFCSFKTNRLSNKVFHLHKHMFRKYPCKFDDCIFTSDKVEALRKHELEHHEMKVTEEGGSFKESVQNCNPNGSVGKVVEVLIKEEQVSDNEDAS